MGDMTVVVHDLRFCLRKFQRIGCVYGTVGGSRVGRPAGWVSIPKYGRVR